jgi:hypothetical protein
VSVDQLPTFHCWRCDSPCDVNWCDAATLGSTEPELLQGVTRCTNDQCKGRFDQSAHIPPSPETLVRRGERTLHRIRQIAAEGSGPACHTVLTCDAIIPHLRCVTRSRAI